MRSITVEVAPDGSVRLEAKKLAGLRPGNYHAILLVGEQAYSRERARIYVWAKNPSVETRELLAHQKAYDCTALGGVRQGRVFDFKPDGYSPPEGFLEDIGTIASVLTDNAVEDCEIEIPA